MIELDANSSVPPYEQIRSGLAARISTGELRAGARLPTVRALADELQVAVNTVARAYRELELAGLVATHGRAGTTVNAVDGARQRLAEAAARYADTAHTLGVDDDDAVAQLRSALEAARSR